MRNHVFFFQAGIGSSTVLNNLSDEYTFHRTHVNLVAFFLLSVHIVAYITALDADHSTLHGTVFLDVVNYLVHDTCRNGESVADVRACRRCYHGVDTNQCTVGVYECTARVALIDGSISLNHRCHLAWFLHRAGFCRYDTCSDGVVQSQRVAYCKYPFTDLHVVGVGNNNGRQVLSVNLDECEVCGGIGSDDAG